MKKSLLAFILLVFAALGIGTIIMKYRIHSPSNITIFIHGSRSAAKYVLPQKYQSKQGLYPVIDYSVDSHYYEIAEIFQEKDPATFSMKNYYVFGWDGALSFDVRKKLAQKLRNQLEPVLDAYKQKDGCYPEVTIITFSHGGNIALQLADFLGEVESKYNKVNLLLIGCPVQATTEHMIASSYFNHVSVVSSRGDVIQRMDPHNLYGPERDEKTRLFSRRFFDVENFDNFVQNKIDQYAVTVNGKILGHVDLFRSFMIHIPYVLEQQEDTSDIIEVDIEDNGFIFNKVYNLEKSLKGKRKD